MNGSFINVGTTRPQQSDAGNVQSSVTETRYLELFGHRRVQGHRRGAKCSHNASHRFSLSLYTTIKDVGKHHHTAPDGQVGLASPVSMSSGASDSRETGSSWSTPQPVVSHDEQKDATKAAAEPAKVGDSNSNQQYFRSHTRQQNRSNKNANNRSRTKQRDRKRRSRINRNRINRNCSRRTKHRQLDKRCRLSRACGHKNRVTLQQRMLTLFHRIGSVKQRQTGRGNSCSASRSMVVKPVGAAQLGAQPEGGVKAARRSRGLSPSGQIYHACR
ncbi:uncharacterized protein [Dermacentor albipictus]|uniref:uncharacterized protein isoform X2 n=1 Tax=Dermacentor albipictus TaxID=60249 RepID=UPI0038FD071B